MTIAKNSPFAQGVVDIVRKLKQKNVLKSLELGIRIFDSSSGGLGGCPYAKGATGNVATEDLLYLCEAEGLSTGIDLEKIMDASIFILNKVNKTSPSKFFITKLKERL